MYYIHYVITRVTAVTIRICCRAISRVKLRLFLLPVLASFNYLYLNICICVFVFVFAYLYSRAMKLLLFLISVLASSNYFTLGVLMAWPATALPSIR